LTVGYVKFGPALKSISSHFRNLRVARWATKPTGAWVSKTHACFVEVKARGKTRRGR
jgi:hypothetical protein